MLAKDMKPGIVYAYREGSAEYRDAKPIVVLDTDTLYTQTRERVHHDQLDTKGAVPQWVESYEKRPKRSNSGLLGRDTGYLAVMQASHVGRQRPALPIAEMLAADPAALIASTVKEHRELPARGITVDVINPRWIIGEWAAHLITEEQTRQLRDEHDRRTRERGQQRQAEARAASEHLTALGIAHTLREVSDLAYTFEITPAEAMKITGGPR